MYYNSPTFRLIRKKTTILEGIASLVDLFGRTHHNYKFDHIKLDADAAAINSDWQAVGGDMKKAIHDVTSESRNK